MFLREARRLAILIGTHICAHGGCNSATAPSPLPAGYAGEWTGTTVEGTFVQFSVSATDHVMSLILTYNFSAACSGTLRTQTWPCRSTGWIPRPTTLRSAGVRFWHERGHERDGDYRTLLAGSTVGIGSVHPGLLRRLRRRHPRHMERPQRLTPGRLPTSLI